MYQVSSRVGVCLKVHPGNRLSAIPDDRLATRLQALSPPAGGCGLGCRLARREPFASEPEPLAARTGLLATASQAGACLRPARTGPKELTTSINQLFGLLETLHFCPSPLQSNPSIFDSPSLRLVPWITSSTYKGRLLAQPSLPPFLSGGGGARAVFSTCRRSWSILVDGAQRSSDRLRACRTN